MLETFTVNLTKGKKTRFEMLEGKEYLVVPMVMITEGVHNGSNGPLFYSNEELAKTPVVWNHKPVVIYHPQINGKGVSACDPVIMEARKVGIILNTHWTDKLRAEAWLDIVKMKKIDPETLERIEKGEVVEVSTGLFTDNDDTASGEWNGKPYVATVRNLRPDHLAILPTGKGACSIEDGAGLLANEERKRGHPLTERVLSNAASFMDVTSAVRKALAAKHGKPGQHWDGYIEDIYPENVIFYDENGLKSQNYSVDSMGKVTLSGNAIEIECCRTTEYRKKDGSPINNEGKTMTPKEQRVAALITANVGWTDKDKEFLVAMADDKFEILEKSSKPPVVQNQVVVTPAPVPVNNNQPAPTPALSFEQLLATAPPQYQEMVRNGLNAHNQEKARLIGIITANARNKFTKEYLETQTNDVLFGFASLAQDEPTQNGHVPVLMQPNYLGASGAAPVQNQVAEEEPLALPTMNWDQK